jgi:hypothetical protein
MDISRIHGAGSIGSGLHAWNENSGRATRTGLTTAINRVGSYGHSRAGDRPALSRYNASDRDGRNAFGLGVRFRGRAPGNPSRRYARRAPASSGHCQ